MSFEFDTPLPLRAVPTSKYGNIENVFGYDTEDMIPMWVADMDFAAAPAIRAAVQREVETGYFGYYGDTTAAAQSVSDWYKTQHGWAFDPKAIYFTHGVINGFADVIMTHSQPGDGVIVFPPVYHVFYKKTQALGRQIVESPLVLRDGQYHMDLDALAASLQGHERIVTLCSPHNPGGRIWTADEIKALAAFCKDHDLILVSDEIHMDLAFPGVTFTPTLLAAPEAADRTYVISAASKGFNIAGGETAFLIAVDDGLRARIDKTMKDRESSPNRFGMAMMHAAFLEGAEWSDACRAYIAENFRILADRLGAVPGVSVMDMNATYLSWVDFTNTGMNDAELMERLLKDAQVAPSPGPQFGLGGSQHMRFNIALPRPTLVTAISRIEQAFSDLQ